VYINAYVNVPQTIAQSSEDEHGVCVSNDYCCATMEGKQYAACSAPPAPDVVPAPPPYGSTGSAGPAPDQSTGSAYPTPAPSPSPYTPPSAYSWSGTVTQKAAERACYVLSVNAKTGAANTNSPAYLACMYDCNALDNDATAAASLISAVAYSSERVAPDACTAHIQVDLDVAHQVAATLCSTCSSIDACTQAIEVYQAKIGANVACMTDIDTQQSYDTVVLTAKKCEKVYDSPAATAYGAALPTHAIAVSLHAVLCLSAVVLRIL